MERLTENKIILVTRRTRLDELIDRFNTIGQAQFYLHHLQADFSDYQLEHEVYYSVLKETISILHTMGRLQVLDRSHLPNFIFGGNDTVVVLGQDGLVANTVKYLASQPVIGVNPDPARWDGVLLPFVVNDVRKIVAELFGGKRRIKEVTMAKAQLNDGQVLYAVNDLFIGPKTHVSARYTIQVGHRSEQHSSSGLIVSTGLGSTGWFKSLIAGALGIASELGGTRMDPPMQKRTPWDAPYLYFTVREPFPSRTSSADLVFGRVTTDSPLLLTSLMPEHGVIFSDGIETDFIQFNSGTRAVITPAEKKGQLVV